MEMSPDTRYCFAAMIHRVLHVIFALAAVISFPSHAAPADPKSAVVHITTYGQRPIWNAPWRLDHVRSSTGSGFIISGRRIVTNAHVVSWAKEILVRRFRDPNPYRARVAFIGHDCDLAVLEVEDQAFFDGMSELELGPMPPLRSTVTTVGFPAGGDEISYTRGVVSRIENKVYSHNRIRSFLAGQTDAAINPGNSGGPVVFGGKVVGVAFQNASNLENVGYFIPTPVVSHFLTDIEDGHYDGFPDGGFTVSSLANPAFRRYLQLDEKVPRGIGVRVDALLPSSTPPVVVDDVLVEVAGKNVANDGTVLHEGNRVFVGALFDQVQAGDSIEVKVLRNGQETPLDIPLSVYTRDAAQGRQYDRLPPYFIHAGLVFTPLSADYLSTFGDDLGATKHPDFFYELSLRQHEDPQGSRPEPVVLIRVLPHEVNADLQLRGPAIVDRVNGVRIDRLVDVVTAFEQGDGRFDIIEFLPEASFQALEREPARAASAEILARYRIPADRRLR